MQAQNFSSELQGHDAPSQRAMFMPTSSRPAGGTLNCFSCECPLFLKVLTARLEGVTRGCVTRLPLNSACLLRRLSLTCHFVGLVSILECLALSVCSTAWSHCSQLITLLGRWTIIGILRESQRGSSVSNLPPSFGLAWAGPFYDPETRHCSFVASP